MPKVAQEQPKETTAQWWARESSNLYVYGSTSDGESRTVRFSDFFVTLDLSDPLHAQANDMLSNHRSNGADFLLVLNQKNSDAEQKVMLKAIRQLLSPPNDGHVDDVAKTSGILKLAAMFTDEELSELGTRRRSPDIDLLTLKASSGKFIKGIE